MRTAGSYAPRTPVAMLLSFALAACGRPDTADRGHLDGFVEMAVALTDAGIMAILDEENRSDSVAAALAVEKATDADVRAFASSVLEDDRTLRRDADRLVKLAGLTPGLPASDPLGPAAEEQMIALRSTPRGPGFDRVYVEKEVATLAAAEEFADEAKRSSPGDEVRDYIDRVTPVLQRERTRAQALRSHIAKTT